ncbi:hypothetical protein V4F39_01795 [Aquincola sp. MAHUQ-54]|uniref:Outer membrane protein beta-barrel domain-containing protein n=1 Tax=Aquincola agrisoli TaxID=3119538 RepID=A0AAW9PZT3_9BURK
MKQLASVVLTATFAASAAAGDLYLGAGLPGLSVGYAHPLNDRFSLRADLTTIGRLSKGKTEDGLRYDGDIRADRLGLFADWFVAGKFRLTGGLTLHDARASLAGRGNGGTITIGDTTYVAGPDDRLRVKVKYPTVMPYLGVGFGRPPRATGGWGFMFDAGLSMGKPKVTGRATGPLLSNAVAQDDIDRELEDIRDDFERIRGIPQLNFSVHYRF